MDLEFQLPDADDACPRPRARGARGGGGGLALPRLRGGVPVVPDESRWPSAGWWTARRHPPRRRGARAGACSAPSGAGAWIYEIVQPVAYEGGFLAEIRRGPREGWRPGIGRALLRRGSGLRRRPRSAPPGPSSTARSERALPRVSVLLPVKDAAATLAVPALPAEPDPPRPRGGGGGRRLERRIGRHPGSGRSGRPPASGSCPRPPRGPRGRPERRPRAGLAPPFWRAWTRTTSPTPSGSASRPRPWTQDPSTAHPGHPGPVLGGGATRACRHTWSGRTASWTTPPSGSDLFVESPLVAPERDAADRGPARASAATASTAGRRTTTCGCARPLRACASASSRGAARVAGLQEPSHAPDPRYAPARSFERKLEALLEGPLPGGRAGRLWGAGEIGKAWARALPGGGLELVRLRGGGPAQAGPAHPRGAGRRGGGGRRPGGGSSTSRRWGSREPASRIRPRLARGASRTEAPARRGLRAKGSEKRRCYNPAPAMGPASPCSCPCSSPSRRHCPRRPAAWRSWRACLELEDTRGVGRGGAGPLPARPDRSVRRRAALAAGRIGRQALVPTLGGPDERRRSPRSARWPPSPSASSAIPPAADRLVASLKDTEGHRARARVEALGRLGEPRVAADGRRVRGGAGAARPQASSPSAATTPANPRDPWVELRLALFALYRLKEPKAAAAALLRGASRASTGGPPPSWPRASRARRSSPCSWPRVLERPALARLRGPRPGRAQGRGAWRPARQPGPGRRRRRGRHRAQGAGVLGDARGVPAAAAQLELAEHPPCSARRCAPWPSLPGRPQPARPPGAVRGREGAMASRPCAPGPGPQPTATTSPSSSSSLDPIPTDGPRRAGRGPGRRGRRGRRWASCTRMLKDPDPRVLPAVLEALRKARGADAVDTLRAPPGALRLRGARGGRGGLGALKAAGQTRGAAGRVEALASDGADLDARLNIVAALAPRGSRARRTRSREIAAADPVRVVRERAAAAPRGSGRDPARGGPRAGAALRRLSRGHGSLRDPAPARASIRPAPS